MSHMTPFGRMLSQGHRDGSTLLHLPAEQEVGHYWVVSYKAPLGKGWWWKALSCTVANAPDVPVPLSCSNSSMQRYLVCPPQQPFHALGGRHSGTTSIGAPGGQPDQLCQSLLLAPFFTTQWSGRAGAPQPDCMAQYGEGPAGMLLVHHQ